MDLKFFRYFSKLLIILLSSTVSISHAKDAYTWMVVPQFTGIAVHRDWSPILQALEKATGYHFELKLSKSIPEFEIAFSEGGPDFAYMNPYHSVMARKAQGYEPIIRDNKRKLKGILVVRKDSKVNSIQDLQGGKIAFPSPNAFAASLYIRALLSEQEKIKFTPIYAKTHTNSYRYVLLNKTPASGGVFRTLKRERSEVQNNLKVIYKTPSSPSHPIVVHKRVSSDVAIKVQKAIISLANTKEGKVLLKAVLIPNPIDTSFEHDYKALQDLNLKKYVVHHAK